MQHWTLTAGESPDAVNTKVCCRLLQLQKSSFLLLWHTLTWFLANIQIWIFDWHDKPTMCWMICQYVHNDLSSITLQRGQHEVNQKSTQLVWGQGGVTQTSLQSVKTVGWYADCLQLKVWIYRLCKMQIYIIHYSGDPRAVTSAGRHFSPCTSASRKVAKDITPVFLPLTAEVDFQAAVPEMEIWFLTPGQPQRLYQDDASEGVR